MRNLISTEQFTNVADLKHLFCDVDSIRGKLRRGDLEKCLTDRIVGLVFHERSTRTRCSFEAAAYRLGANVIFEPQTTSSSGKQERIEDTIRTMSQYCDLLVLRHPDAGVAERVAPFSYVPLINGGDGDGEHPTQALLDLYTIYRKLGERGKYDLGQLKLMFCGDLSRGRTVHSWLPLLRNVYPEVRVYLAAYDKLELPPDMRNSLPNATVIQEKDIEKFLPEVDVLYMTRVQFERAVDLRSQHMLVSFFKLRPEHLEKMKKTAMILHPLPRNGEIHPDCDSDERCLYHTEQVTNGLYLRMALLARLVHGDLFSLPAGTLDGNTPEDRE